MYYCSYRTYEQYVRYVDLYNIVELNKNNIYFIKSSRENK